MARGHTAPRGALRPRARHEAEPIADVFYPATGRRRERAPARAAPRPGPAAQGARRLRAHRVRAPARPGHERRAAPGPDRRPMVRLAASALGAHRADRRDAGRGAAAGRGRCPLAHPPGALTAGAHGAAARAGRFAVRQPLLRGAPTRAGRRSGTRRGRETAHGGTRTQTPPRYSPRTLLSPTP